MRFRMSSAEIIIATIARRILELRKNVAGTDPALRAGGSVAATSAVAAGVIAAPLILPLTGAAALFGARNMLGTDEQPPREKLAAPKEEKIYNDDTALDDLAVREATSDAAISELIREAANVLQFRRSMPSTKVTGEKRLVGRKATAPLRAATPDAFADKLASFAEDGAGLPTTIDELRDLVRDFANTEAKEEFNVLSAAQVLRDQFHLTPKPNIRWGQRKKLGADTSVADVFGEHAPNLDFLERKLSELTLEQWWTAFYKEDAAAGRIGDRFITDTDAGFRKSYTQELGLRSLTPLMGGAPLDERRKQIAAVLGTDSPDQAQSFMIPGSPKKASANISAKSA